MACTGDGWAAASRTPMSRRVKQFEHLSGTNVPGVTYVTGMADAKGFWSYVHKDDDAEGGRIAQLARDLVNQFEMLSGQSLRLFLDRDDIEWGNDWRAEVDGSISTTAFFIPVLTPRFFQSVECRHELNLFVRKASQLGLGELIMPILYVTSAAMDEEPPSDDAVALIKPYQWVDWTSLRLEATDSSEYRRAVAKMAQRLVDANSRADAESRAIVLPHFGGLDDDEPDDDEPGTADLMAIAEETLPVWMETIEGLGDDIALIGEVVVSGTARLNTPGVANSFAGRLTTFRQVANDLRAPSESIRDKAMKFSAQLNKVDLGVMEMIPMIAAEVESGSGTKDSACEFFESLRQLAISGDDSMGSISGMIESIKPVESQSRDLRKPLKTLRQGLTLMAESRKVMSGWVAAMDATGLECFPPLDQGSEPEASATDQTDPIS